MVVNVPEFLVVGHITRDLVGQSYQPGGTAFYAAVTAARLGLRVAVVTAGEVGMEAVLTLPPTQVFNVAASRSTVFENVYEGEARTQYLHSLAPPIPSNRLPKEWTWCPIVLLGPVANEVSPKFLSQFPRSLVGLSVQGWLRQWDREGRVFASPAVLPKETAKAQVVFLSRQDLPSGETPNFASLDKSILILTEGKGGARFRWRGKWYKVPAFPACSADVTGAGDVFAAAFLVRYHKCGDPLDAALYASAASSLKVEVSGADGVPDGRQVAERMSMYPQHRVVLYG